MAPTFVNGIAHGRHTLPRIAFDHNVWAMGDAGFRGFDGFTIEAHAQLAFFEARSPAHARFLRSALDLVERDDAVRSAIVASWETRAFHARFERPLLLCAAVRFDALRDPSHPLVRALADAPELSDIDDRTVRASLLRPDALASMRDRFVQTNEVTRACAWRVVASAVGGDQPWALADLGCSAGLNLVADRAPLVWPDAAGVAIPIRDVDVVARLGLDRAPVDPRNEIETTWLRACLWPGQLARIARFETALARAREAATAGDLALEACDAVEMPNRLHALSASHPSARVLAYQTVFADYLLPDDRARYESLVRAWLVAHAARAVWSELERDPENATRAQIRVHFAVDGAVRSVVLASCDYHPESLDLHDDAIRALATATR